MKRIISLVLACVLSLAIMPQSNAVTQRELNEENADFYNTDMITYFEREVGYPDNYGGAWLNQNNGHLVIGLTERNAEIEEYYYDVTGADILEFETVEYSLQELYDAMVDTAENVKRAKSLPQVNGSAIIQRTNSVDMYVAADEVVSYISAGEVTLIPNRELNEAKSNADIINFKVSGPMRLEAAIGNVGGGMKISSGVSNATASIGYLAYRYEGATKQVGVVTAAHTSRGFIDHAYTPNGQKIGDVTYLCWAGNYGNYDIDDLGTEDFVFIHFNAGNTISPVIKYDTLYSQDLSVRYVVPAEGTIIHKSGETTQHTMGFVESIYYYDNEHYSETAPTVQRIMAGYNSDEGDSGGIVYTRGSNGKANVVGIHQGSSPVNYNQRAISIPAFHLESQGICAGQ